MNTTLVDLLGLLQSARKPEDVFGPFEAPLPLKRRFHELLRVAHPDHNPSAQVEANEAMKLLQTWYSAAQRANTSQVHAGDPRIEAVTRLHHYVGHTPPLRGDLCDLFPATADGEPVLLKVARAARNNDLLQAEARALLRIARELDGQAVRAHFPVLIEQFQLRDMAGAQRQAHALRWEQEYVSLADVLAAYPDGIHPADAAWMFNRLLAALGTIHSLGLVHGAVLLPHVLIRPADHNGMLIDWCYSVHQGATIQAISPPYTVDYPPEVRTKAAATPATDLYMAARCMARLLGGDGTEDSLPPRVPRPLRALLRACLIPTPQRRAQNAWQVFEDFQNLLRRLYGPATFRPFHMPVVP